MKTNKYPKKEVTIDGMSLYSICRWAALKEAIDIIGDKCDEKKIDFDTFNDLKPLNILNYVDSLTDVFYDKAVKEYETN